MGFFNVTFSVNDSKFNDFYFLSISKEYVETQKTCEIKS